MKVCKDNIHPLPSTINCSKAVLGWSAKVFTFVFLKLTLSTMSIVSVVIKPCCDTENMENTTVQWTKDLNIKDQADFKKKHKCNQCNFSTATAGNLKSHKLIHSGEKPFACSQCKYSCNRAGSLKKTPSHPLRGESFQMQTMRLFLQRSWQP